MAPSKEQDQEIIKRLKNVMKLYRTAITMPYEKRERIILQYIGLLCKNKEILEVKNAIDQVLANYPEGHYPHDSTLIDEVEDSVSYPYKKIFSYDTFNEDILIFKMYDLLIAEEFEPIYKFPLDRHEEFIIKRLWKSVHCTLVDNPNLKGDNPHHKRYSSDFHHSKKTWLELLDKDYQSYIEYFGEESA